MNNILEMIKNEKVEWKKLGDVCEIRKGKQFNKRDMLEAAPYPVINGGMSPSGYVEVFNTNENTITVSQGGASAGFVNFIKTKFWLGAHAFSVIPKSNISNRYIYHTIKMNQDKLQGAQEGAGIPSVSKKVLSMLKIPFPSLEVQEKIANTLDKFTDYVTELEFELESRNKQYEYIRDMLLSEEYLNKISEKIDGLDSMSRDLVNVELKEITKIRNGKDWKTLGRGAVPVYGSGGKMNEYVDKYSYNKPTVLIPRKGSIENVFYLEEPFWNVDTVFYTEIDNDKVIPKYFYYFIENYDVRTLSTNSTRPSLTQSALNKVKITLPTLEIQNKVVELLDKFQDLLNDTQGLLPEEIDQRQKQYEFYREKLLTFNAESVNTHTHTHTQLIPNSYFLLLNEVAEIVGVSLTTKIRTAKINDVFIRLRGTSITAKKMKEIENDEGDIKIFAGGQTVVSAYKMDIPKANIINQPAVLVQSRGKIDVIYYEEPFTFKNEMWAYTNENIDSVKYLFYVLKNDINKFRNIANSMGSFPQISLYDTEEYKILLPSLSVQKYIVDKLDMFDSLVNNISVGLPKEIEQRQKQYEYYRNKLLDFSENK